MIVSAVGSAGCLDAGYDENVVFRIRRNISHANISSGDAVCNKHNAILPFFVRIRQILDLMLSLS